MLVIVKKNGLNTMFLSTDESITNGAFTEDMEDAELFDESDSTRDLAREMGAFPVDVKFYTEDPEGEYFMDGGIIHSLHKAREDR